MSDIVKQVIENHKKDMSTPDVWATKEALEIARIYAGSANARATNIPILIDNLIYLFKTGERK